MPKSVQDKLKSATKVIATLKNTIWELEGIIQAHSLARQWRETSEIAKYWGSQEATATMRHSGKARELGMGYGELGCYVMPEFELGETMAEAHRQIEATMGLPSEFIGVDMADSPGSAASVEASIEAGNIILHNIGYGQDPASHTFADPESDWGVGQAPIVEQEELESLVPEYPARVPKEDLKHYLIGLDPNVITTEKWQGNGITIFKQFDDDLEAGFELFNEWSAGALGGVSEPVWYSLQRTETQWEKFITDAEA